MMDKKEFNISQERTKIKDCEIDVSEIDVSLNPVAEDANAYRLLVDKPY